MSQQAGSPVTTSTCPDEVEASSGSEDYNEGADPMVSKPVKPFLISVVIRTASETRECKALVDSGYTRCLMSTAMAGRLGVCLKRLSNPIHFEQMDGSLLGGRPATHITEQVTLEIGLHQERICFVVVPRIMEDMVLGLVWLDKWAPTIWWGGCRHLRLAIGPDPPPHEQCGRGSDLKREERGELGFPEVYKDLKEEFSEWECDTLPPHCMTDCAIEILPGVVLPKPKMYSMTPPRNEELYRQEPKMGVHTAGQV